MKKLKLSLFAVLLVGALAFNPGCATSEQLDPAGVYQGDSVLYNADQSISTSYAALDSFVTWERANQAMVSPAVHAHAEKVRKQAPGWFKTATTMRDAYKADPNPENRLKLLNILGILRTALNEATAMMIQNSNLNK